MDFIKNNNGSEQANNGQDSIKKPLNKKLHVRDSTITKVMVKTYPNLRGYSSDLYRNIVKQNGYWRGIGRPLTAVEARHLRCYYKLSRRTPWGPYTHMQTLDANGRLTTNHTIGIYMGRNDDGMTSTWQSKIEEACQWEIIGDVHGVCEENAYNSNGELLFQYHPMALSDSIVVGYFADEFGIIATPRKDSRCKRVRIVLDRNGYERDIIFTDDKGHPILNHDDVFMQRREHDAHGNVTRVLSCDITGRSMRDNCGNCGWEYAYDARGNCLMATCIDADGTPMRMPEKKSNHNFTRSVNTLDKWGRCIKTIYLDAEMQPDTLNNGVHKEVYAFDDHGNCTLWQYFGLDSVSLRNSSTGAATVRKAYDTDGNMTYAIYRDKDGLLVNGSNSRDCILIRRYMDGHLVLREDYDTDNGLDSTLNWRVVCSALGQNTLKNTAYTDTTWMFGSKKIEVETYDSRHRLVCDAYYNLERTPINSTILGYHKKETVYVDDPVNHRSIETTTWYDKSNQLASIDLDPEYDIQDYNIRRTEVDSVALTKIYTRFHGQRITDKYGYEYSPGFTKSLALIHFDDIGMHARTHNADALYYKAYPIRTEDGTNVAWVGVNEFGEPSYIHNGDWNGATVYHIRMARDKCYYDENGDSIVKNTALNDKLNKAFCIELVDSVGLRLGLLSGDLIVRYGNWIYSEPSTSGRYYQSKLTYEAVTKADSVKTITVMRHDPVSRTSSLITLQLPQGTMRQLGFISHMIMMTSMETSRYKRTIKGYGMQHELPRQNATADGDEGIHFVTPYKVGDDDDKKAYNDGLNEDGLLVATEKFKNGKSYLFTHGDSYAGLSLMMEFDKYDSVAVYYTTDCRIVKRYFLPNDSLWNIVRISQTNDMPLTPSLFNLADSLRTQLEHHEQTMCLHPHEAALRLASYSTGQMTTFTDSTEVAECIEGLPIAGVDSVTIARFKPEGATLEEVFEARDMLKSIDFTNYMWSTHDKFSDFYFLPSDTCATEVVSVFSKTIYIIHGARISLPTGLVAFTVEEDGHMRQKGYEGDYALLRVNNWTVGQSLYDVREQMSGDEQGIRHITMAPLTNTDDGRLTLGRPFTLQFPPGTIGIRWRWQPADGHLFRQLTKQVKRMEKERR